MRPSPTAGGEAARIAGDRRTHPFPLLINQTHTVSPTTTKGGGPSPFLFTPPPHTHTHIHPITKGRRPQPLIDHPLYTPPHTPTQTRTHGHPKKKTDDRLLFPYQSPSLMHPRQADDREPGDLGFGTQFIPEDPEEFAALQVKIYTWII